jgi:SMC interacting uncharacterized protein involved in chromosome segregation
MGKTISELQAELSRKDKDLKKVKLRTSSLRGQVLERERYIKTLINQYERVVTEWKKTYDNLIQNGWKILIIKILQKYHKLKGGVK